ncbi:MAG: bifunctional nicotinamidase/pyrazinamidase [Simkaniaceae bacterium]|jgi:nicotinamidase/pyrazinamidase|nr:MAG: bifunctional nicotinamidase/pyrazinamidase [Simkaniaceae bacterium]
MTEALLIVDLQYDFMPGGALGVSGGDEIIPIINKLVGKFDYTIVSQDYHPEGHVSFANTHNKEVGEIIDINGTKQELWPIHCVEQTHGAALVKELKKDHIDRYFHKGTDLNIDSYSAFFDNDKEHETGLDDFLRDKGVSTLYIVGLTTEFCVKFSALDALELGYEVIVIKDGCRPIHDDKKALEEMKKAGAKIVTLKHLLSRQLSSD